MAYTPVPTSAPTPQHQEGPGSPSSWASVGTDVKLQTEIYSYSRSRGLFAGVSLEGASLATDDNANEAVYGRVIGPEELLFGRGGALPAELAVFVRNLERFGS